MPLFGRRLRRRLRRRRRWLAPRHAACALRTACAASRRTPASGTGRRTSRRACRRTPPCRATGASRRPGPVAIISGTTPRMKAKAVIRIGRSRSRQASTAASTADRPRSCACRANSTIRMAFLAARPISTIRPICTRMLLSSPRKDTPSSAASTPSGTISTIANGSTQLSYCAASARNTNSTDSPKMKTAALPVLRSW